MINDNTDDFIVGALIGSAIGIAAALMFTPVSGVSLRNKIANGFGASQKSSKKATHAKTATHAAHKVKRAAPKVVRKASADVKKRSAHS